MSTELEYDSTNWTYLQFNYNDTLLETNDSYPDYPSFNKHSLNVVIVYCGLFLVAAIGNLTVFVSLFRSRHRKSRISLMIRHLSIADLVVTFVMIPLEVGWRITVQWVAGNWACKAFLFLRAFGLYLSSNVLVCVSLDRYFAVLHPLKVNDARRRGKLMLAWAWSVSLIYAVPQSVVFHVAPHPHFPSFKQCVTFGFFTSAKQEIAYNLFCVIAMYFVPLLVIVVAYTAILCEISNKSKDSGGENYQTSNGRMRLRRSDISNIERARTRTLRMTITIVVVFVICWTPYVVMTLWYMFDRDSAEQVPTWLQDALFMMAVSNSCMNPLVYGSYAINFRRECCKCLSCFRSNSSQNNFANGQTVFSAGQGVRISKRLLKCARSIRTVGSGVTRSTGMMHGVGNRSPIVRPDNQLVGLLPKRTRGLTERPPSVGHISFLSEPLASRGYRTSFHSEPCPCPDNAGENSQHSQSSQGTVPPDIL